MDEAIYIHSIAVDDKLEKALKMIPNGSSEEHRQGFLVNALKGVLDYDPDSTASEQAKASSGSFRDPAAMVNRKG